MRVTHLLPHLRTMEGIADGDRVDHQLTCQATCHHVERTDRWHHQRDGTAVVIAKIAKQLQSVHIAAHLVTPCTDVLVVMAVTHQPPQCRHRYRGIRRLHLLVDTVNRIVGININICGLRWRQMMIQHVCHYGTSNAESQCQYYEPPPNPPNVGDAIRMVISL